MLVITLGYSLGKREIRGVSLGPAAGTLFLALLLGHLGFVSGSAILGSEAISLGTFGFALFIYSVGFDAAPHFLSSFKERRGWQFVAIGIQVNLVALGLTVVFAKLFEIDASSAAGMLAGALTSAPTFAAAFEVAPDPTLLSVAFAITSPFGLVGIVVLIQLLPRFLGVDLAKDAISDDEAHPDFDPRQKSSGASLEVSRAFEVRVADCAGRSLRDLDLSGRTGCVISRLHQGDDVVIPSGDSILELGDRVLATGRLDELQKFELCVGPEVDPGSLHSKHLATRRIQVRHSSVTGQSLSELRILNRFHCVVTRVERGALWIEPDADVTLVLNDVLEVVGSRGDLRGMASALGQFEVPSSETDIAVYAGGILLGTLVGSLQFEISGFVVQLGMAGGLLATGLLLGVQEQIGPFRTHVPREARQLVRDLGILIFVGETGLGAGAGIAEGLANAPLSIFVAGSLVNVLTILSALLTGRWILGLRPLDAWGSICGGLTSSSALHAVRRASDSNESAISYAAAYAVASVLATMAGPLVVLFLR